MCQNVISWPLGLLYDAVTVVFAVAENLKTSTIAGRGFLLEIDNRQNRNTVATAIQKYGGEILVTYHEYKLPMVVVSDHALTLKIEQKKIDVQNPTEKILRALPSLLREVVQGKIKIRTIDTFMKQLTAWTKRNTKTSSATNSTGTMKVVRAPIQQAPRRVINDTADMRRRSSIARHGRGFVRIDAPGKKPDIRVIDKALFGQWYSGSEAGFSVFRMSDELLKIRRTRDFDIFMRGEYVATKKSNFKLEDEETYCQFCGKTVERMCDHERTDAHKSGLKHNGIVADLARVVMTMRMALNRRKRASIEMSDGNENSDPNPPPAKLARIEEYEYGENEYRVKWDDFVEKNIDGENNEIRAPTKLPMATFFDQSNEAAFLSFIGKI